MFEAHLLRSSKLTNVIEVIKDFLTQATFRCDENGIQLQGMDNSQVSVVIISLWADGFDKYRCDNKITMGVNLISMVKILKRAADNDTLTMKAQEDAETVTFVFESPNRVKVGEYEMQLIRLDVEQFGIPERQYSCTIRMPSDQFARICSHLSLFGDVFGIACTKDTVTFSAFADVGSTNVELTQTGSLGEHAVIVEVGAPFSQAYPCPYLNDFAKVTSLSSQVRLSMSADVPLVIEYRIQKLWHIKCYLDPAIVFYEPGNNQDT